MLPICSIAFRLARAEVQELIALRARAKFWLMPYCPRPLGQVPFTAHLCAATTSVQNLMRISLLNSQDRVAYAQSHKKIIIKWCTINAGVQSAQQADATLSLKREVV